jgi:hypothetical protein
LTLLLSDHGAALLVARRSPGRAGLLAALGDDSYLYRPIFVNTALAAILSFYDRVAYPSYANAPRFGLDPLSDQATAGAIRGHPDRLRLLFRRR